MGKGSAEASAPSARAREKAENGRVPHPRGGCRRSSGFTPVPKLQLGNHGIVTRSVSEGRTTTIIFSTHDMVTAENLCDFIFMIFRGKKVLDGTLASIQDEFGDDTIRLRIDGDGQALGQIPGVHRINHRGHLHELRINNDSDPQEILRTIMSRARVQHFELAKPSLHDIFVRIAGPEVEESTHA